LWLLGYPDQSQQCTQSALQVARTLEHAHSQAFALLVGGVHMAQMRREPDDLQKWLDELDALATAHQIVYMQALTHFYQGWLSARKDPAQAQVAVECMWQSLEAWLATGMKALETWHLAALADVCLATGQWAEAQRALDAGLAAVEETQAGFVAAELHRLQGELLLAEDRDAEAEACFRRAIQVADQQQARSLELRATMSLARLLGQRGRGEEAYTNLVEIYGRFSEGFDTPDLQEAQRLLRDLARESQS
jgi:adenylate cyclase